MQLKHVALYAKGYYQRTNLWEDLRKCLAADGYDSLTEWWNNRYTVNLIVSHVSNLFKNKDIGTYTAQLLFGIDEHNSWRFGYIHDKSPGLLLSVNKEEDIKPYDKEEAVVRFFISELVCSKTADLGGLPEADENVLPLADEVIKSKKEKNV